MSSHQKNSDTLSIILTHIICVTFAIYWKWFMLGNHLMYFLLFVLISVSCHPILFIILSLILPCYTRYSYWKKGIYQTAECKNFELQNHLMRFTFSLFHFIVFFVWVWGYEKRNGNICNVLRISAVQIVFSSIRTINFPAKWFFE